MGINVSALFPDVREVALDLGTRTGPRVGSSKERGRLGPFCNVKNTEQMKLILLAWLLIHFLVQLYWNLLVPPLCALLPP